MWQITSITRELLEHNRGCVLAPLLALGGPLFASARDHVIHHARFYLSALLGVIVWVATAILAQPLRLILAGDGFFGVYLVLMAVLATRATAEDMRRRSSFEDEGIILIVLITLTAISLSIGSIFALLNEPERPDTFRLRWRSPVCRSGG